tara:strand:+ start:545 stop:715 length:171 start_codon:yes stop_codon:yes gene_type:complete
MDDKGKIVLMDMYLNNVLAEMETITKSTTKKDMYAYIQAWQNELQTATYVVDVFKK